MEPETLIDDTHDAKLVSWLESANDPATDFPIQNLPLGRFRRPDDPDWSIGVAMATGCWTCGAPASSTTAR